MSPPVEDPWAHHDWWLSAPWHRGKSVAQVEDPAERSAWRVVQHTYTSKPQLIIHVWHGFRVSATPHCSAFPNKWIRRRHASTILDPDDRIELHRPSSKECILLSFIFCQTSGSRRHQPSDMSRYKVLSHWGSVPVGCFCDWNVHPCNPNLRIAGRHSICLCWIYHGWMLGLGWLQIT